MKFNVFLYLLNLLNSLLIKKKILNYFNYIMKFLCKNLYFHTLIYLIIKIYLKKKIKIILIIL